MLQRVEAAPRLLARAFTSEYEVGRFDSAYRIVTLEEKLNPGKIATQDRLLAVGQKRIEQLCAADRPAAAAEIREELDRFDFEPVALDLFDRAVNPTIVSAAVRIEDWTLAEVFVERYAASEADPVESARLPSSKTRFEKQAGPEQRIRLLQIRRSPNRELGRTQLANLKLRQNLSSLRLAKSS